MKWFAPLALALALALVLGVQSPRTQPNISVGTQLTIPITGTVAAATEIVALKTGQRIYITNLNLVPVATSVVTLTTGTGTNCGTSTASLTGAMTFAAGQQLSLGDGSGVVIVTPASFALCITIATAVAPGSLAYAQF